MSERLADRIALVMGGGSVAEGSGKACALRYAREGAKVFVVDRSGDAAEQTARPIRNEGGTSAVGVGDVSIDGDVERLVATCMAALGRTDILHTNVARIDVGDVIELAPDLRDASSSANLKSVFLACRSVIPHMRARKAGANVNISSIAATRYPGVPYMAYHASKVGIVQFTRAVAVRHAADGIRANTILPGFTDTLHIHAFLRDHLGGGDTEALIRKRGSQTPGRPHGHRPGRGQGRRFPGIGRGRLHHRHGTGGGWRRYSDRSFLRSQAHDTDHH